MMQSADAGLGLADREIGSGQRARFLGAERWAGAGGLEAEELERLVADGLEQGFLTYDEIAAGLQEVELKPEQIEDFYTYPARMLDRAGRGGAAQGAPARAARAPR
jgi:hypothetical protein